MGSIRGQPAPPYLGTNVAEEWAEVAGVVVGFAVGVAVGVGVGGGVATEDAEEAVGGGVVAGLHLPRTGARLVVGARRKQSKAIECTA